jgi:hypothetical protein
MTVTQQRWRALAVLIAAVLTVALAAITQERPQWASSPTTYRAAPVAASSAAQMMLEREWSADARSSRGAARPAVSKSPATHKRTHSTSRATSTLSVRGLALRIATCESGDHHGSINWTAQNRHSSASGGFQFLDSTWHSTTGLPGHAKDYPPSVQIAAFWKLYARAGTRPWNASKACWG